MESYRCDEYFVNDHKELIQRFRMIIEISKENPEWSSTLSCPISGHRKITEGYAITDNPGIPSIPLMSTPFRRYQPSKATSSTESVSHSIGVHSEIETDLHNQLKEKALDNLFTYNE